MPQATPIEPRPSRLRAVFSPRTWHHPQLMSESAEREPTEPEIAPAAAADVAVLAGTVPRLAGLTHTYEDELVRDQLEHALFGPPPGEQLAAPELGRYRLERKLGAGRMGSVYLARDKQLQRRVAVKLLRMPAGGDRAKADARFLREATAMARLSHDNVVDIYDVGTEGEQRFIAMEFIDGLTLRAWLEAAPRTLAELLDVFTQAARGLAAAHDAGLVHRDFKPDNVMVRKDGRVLVTDFGLARAGVEDEERGGGELVPADVDLTATGTILGTPAYMAPEQFRGEGTDAKSDQFSFCVALWEALYGERPYAGASFAALSSAVIEGERRRPGRGGVPRWLRRALERGLGVEPSQRWASMHELIEALAPRPRRGRIRRAAILTSALAMCTGFCALVVTSDEFEQEVGQGIERELAAEMEPVMRELEAEIRADEREQIEREQAAADTKLQVVEVDAELGEGLRCVADDGGLTRCELLLSVVERLRAEPPLLVGLGRAVPLTREGQRAGYKLFSMSEHSLLTYMGLEAGDVLRSVDGEAAEDVDAQLVLGLMEAKHVRFGLEREREPFAVEIDFVEALSGPPAYLD